MTGLKLSGPRRVAVLGLAILAVAIPLALTGQARGATAANLQLLAFNEDRFRNYDFTAQTVSASGVDWAITMYFWNNATINKVKSVLGNRYDQTGSPQYGRMTESLNLSLPDNNFVWDADSGKKTTLCPGLPTQPYYAEHYRIYADADDRLYNVTLGFYVFGSSHYDIYECGGGSKTFGYSETTETNLVNYWNSIYGGAVHNSWNFQNNEPYRAEAGNGWHVWQNDAFASSFRVL
jgi:hypothetical protein